MARKPQVLAPLALAGVLAIGCGEFRSGPDGGSALGVDGPSLAVIPPVTGTGTGTLTSLQILSSRQAGSNVHQTRRLTGTLVGALDGNVVEDVQGTIHGNGQVTFHGTVVFTGSVAGCGSGTLHGTLSGKGVAGQPVTETSFRITNQAANTLRVNGTGTIQQVGASLTYEFRYVCH